MSKSLKKIMSKIGVSVESVSVELYQYKDEINFLLNNVEIRFVDGFFIFI